MNDEQKPDLAGPDDAATDATEPGSGSRWEPGRQAEAGAAPLSVSLGGGSPTGPGAPAGPIAHEPIAYQPPPVGVASGPRRTRRRFPALGAAAAALALVVGGAGGYVIAHDAGTSDVAENGGFPARGGNGFAPDGDHGAPLRAPGHDSGSSTDEDSGSDT